MKKLFLNIYTFINHFFYGLKNADKIAFTNTTESDGNGGNIEVSDEAESVYKDLLRGEVTQEVKELRHEMYFAERESHNYEYTGGGKVKKHGRFDDVPELPTQDGYSISIVQDNNEDTGSVLDNLEEKDYGLKNERKYTVTVERDFVPRFKLEEFTNRIVIEKNSDDKVLVDFYVTKYESQFNRRHKPFLNELVRIVNGDKRSEIIDITSVEFISYKAWGIDDLNRCKYYGLKFNKIYEYKGDYILTFECMTYEVDDITDEYYDASADEKEKNHEARKNTISVDYMSVLDKNKEDLTADEENKLIQDFKSKNV